MKHLTKHILVGLILGVFFVGCAQEKGKIEVRAPQPRVLDKVQAQISELLSYEFTGVDALGKTCTTGQRLFADKEEKCLSLQLAEQNADCAKTERQQYFQTHCAGEFNPQVALPKRTPRYKSPRLLQENRSLVVADQVLSCSFSFLRSDQLVDLLRESEPGEPGPEDKEESGEESGENKWFIWVDQLMLSETLILSLPGNIYARVSFDRAPLSDMNERVAGRLGHNYLRQEIIDVEKDVSRAVPVAFAGVLKEQVEEVEALTPVVYGEIQRGTYTLHCELIGESAIGSRAEALGRQP